MMAKCVSFFAMFVSMLFMGSKMEGKEYKAPEYLQYVSEVTSAFLKEMYKKHGFECEASGGKMPHDVEEISVSLCTSRSATVEQARELEIMVTERFAQIINAHEEIRPFLREYPFPPGRANVSIAFRNPKKKKTSSVDDDVILVFQARNRIFYRAKNPDNPYVHKRITDEPYEEALKIVQENVAKNGSQKHKPL